MDKRVKLGAKKRENDIDERRLDVSTGLGLPIYRLDFTKRWAILFFLGRGRFNDGPHGVQLREVLPAQVLHHGARFGRTN